MGETFKETGAGLLRHSGPPSGIELHSVPHAQTSARPTSTTPRAPNPKARAPRRRRRGRYNRYAPWGTWPFVMIFDVAALIVAGMTVAAPTPVIVLLTVATTLVLLLRGLYHSSLSQSVLNVIPDLLASATAVIALGSLGLLSLSPGTSVNRALIGGFTAMVLLVVGRTISQAVIRFARRRRMVSHNTLILGAGRVGADLVQQLRAEPRYGLMPVGYFDPKPRADVGIDMPTFDASEDICHVIEELDAAAVIVAFSSITDQMLVPIIRACDRMACEIFIVPRLFELLPVNHRQTDNVGTTNLIRLPRAAHRNPTWRLKRLFDIVVTGFALILTAPIMVVAALASGFENGWPVLFRQERVGLDGRRFEILKFQTMRPRNETDAATTWNISQDDRVGPVGRLLRISSIDELPQLWNVLRGDMSLVGPRPERPHFVGQFSQEIDTYADRHRVPSGLTGLAQVEGLRGDTSITERARYDNAYVESWSLWTDVKILLRSVVAVVTKRGG